MNAPGTGKGKRHATNPSWMRARRNGEAKVARAEKHAARQARERNRRLGVICLPPPEVVIVDELHVWGPGWEEKLEAVLAVRGT